MLPLSADKTPALPDELAAALAGGFAARGVVVKSVRAEGAGLGALTELRVDVTGARCGREFRVAWAAGEETVVVRAARFALVGEPLEFEGTPLRLRVEAVDAEFRGTGSARDGVLRLAVAESGTVALAVGHAELEALLHRVACGVAAKQGVEVRATKLVLTARGPRALSFRCTVTAKVFVMTAELSLGGELEVDEGLNARLSGLTLGGDAMITKMAAGFARPYLDKLEGRVFPLLAPGLGGVQVRAVEIATTGGLEVRAKFGRA